VESQAVVCRIVLVQSLAGVAVVGAGSYTAKNRGSIVQQSGSGAAKQAERQTAEQNKVEAAQQIEQQAGQVVAVCATSRTVSGCLCNRQTNTRQRGSATDRHVIGRVTGTTGRHQTQAEAAQNQTSRLCIMQTSTTSDGATD
jgi:hypothetical protein